MHRSRLLPFLVIALALSAPAGAANGGAVEREIARLEARFNAAYLANDLPAYFAYYADDLLAVFPDGRTTKAAYRKEWQAYIDAGNRLTGNTLEDLVVRASPAGDEATAVYRVAVETRLASGKTTLERFDETDVWQRRAGRWRVSYVHYSAVPVAAPEVH
jgi:ketosteroid isomerase-like protein